MLRWLKRAATEGEYRVVLDDGITLKNETVLLEADRYNLSQVALAVKQGVGKLMSNGSTGEVEVRAPTGDVLVLVSVKYPK